MNYTSQEEHDHFEGAAEQSVPQKPMTYTEKRLEEFDEQFPLLQPTYLTVTIKDMDYLNRVLKSFLTESIQQAVAEERERVEAKTKGVRDSLLVYFHNAVNYQKAPYRHAIQAIEEEILSSLKNPKSSEKTEEINNK